LPPSAELPMSGIQTLEELAFRLERLLNFDETNNDDFFTSASLSDEEFQEEFPTGRDNNNSHVKPQTPPSEKFLADLHQLHELKAKNHELSEEKIKYCKVNEELSARNESLLKEKNDLQLRLYRLQETTDTQLSCLRQQVYMGLKARDYMIREKISLKKNICKQVKDIEYLKSDLSTFKAEYISNCAKSQKSNRLWHSPETNDDLGIVEKYERSLVENALLKNDIQHLNEYMEKILINDVSRSLKFEEISNTNKILYRQLEEVENSKRGLYSEYMKIQAQILQKEKAERKASKNLSRLQKDYEKVQSENRQLEEEVSRLKEEIEIHKNSTVSATPGECLTPKEKNEKFEEQIISLDEEKKHVDVMSASYSEWEATFENLNKEKEKLEEHLKCSNRIIDGLTQANNELSSTYLEEKRLNVELKESLEMLQFSVSESTKLKEIIRSFSSQVASGESKILYSRIDTKDTQTQTIASPPIDETCNSIKTSGSAEREIKGLPLSIERGLESPRKSQPRLLKRSLSSSSIPKFHSIWMCDTDAAKFATDDNHLCGNLKTRIRRRNSAPNISKSARHMKEGVSVISTTRTWDARISESELEKAIVRAEKLERENQNLKKTLSIEKHNNDLLHLEIEALPDYIALYHKERKALQTQSQRIISNVKEEVIQRLSTLITNQMDMSIVHSLLETLGSNQFFSEGCVSEESHFQHQRRTAP